MERCCCRDMRDGVDAAAKAAVLRVSPSVVSVITHDLPDDMVLRRGTSCTPLMFRGSEGTYACPGSGFIVETRRQGAGAGDDSIYLSTILTPAHLFYRTNQLQPHQIPVAVRLSTGKLHKAQLVVCDFHYNLAVITIQSDSPLPTPTLTPLNDITSITLPNLHSHQDQSFKLQRHSNSNSNSNSFKISPGTNLLTVGRSCLRNNKILLSTCVFRTHDKTAMGCKELFSVKDYKLTCNGGDAVINYSGEVIGICFSNGSVFPINLFSRWWDHYKCSRQLHRISLGVTIVNLHEVRINFLNQFARKFPNIVAGVLVTKVEKNSPAYRCGVKCNDVIIKCGGDLVRSKLEFLERVWDNAGRFVELNVLKTSNGEELNLNITIGKTGSDKLYKWPLPDWHHFGDDYTAEHASLS